MKTLKRANFYKDHTDRAIELGYSCFEDAIEDLWDKHTSTQIAKLFKCSDSAVRKWVSWLGLPKRKRGGRSCRLPETTETREPCSRCGENEWYIKNSRCAPCQRRACRKWNLKNKKK